MSKPVYRLGDYWLSANRHGTWCRTWFDNATRQTRRAALGTRDFEQAQMMLARWVVLNETLRDEQPADVPLDVALARYVASRKDVPSLDAIERAAEKVKGFFGPDEMIAGLTLERQNDLEQDLRERGYSAGYIARIQTTLKAALNRAYKNGEIASAPYVRVVGSQATRERVLSLPEAAALFNAEPPDHIFRFLLLSFNTLARPEALFELQPFQIDFENRLLALNPPGREQTKKHRPTLPITDTLLPWLKAWAGSRYYVQWHDQQKAPVDSIKTTWRTLRADAERLLLEADPKHGGLVDVVPYTIRHTMATELRRRGVPQWEIAGMLGHRADGGVTERYAKFAPDHLGKAAAAIDDYFNELQPLVRREIVLPMEQPKRAFAVIDGGKS